MEQQTSGTDTYRVGVKIPPFWPEEPEVWFAQIEGQFILSNITADNTKFYYVISQLDHQYAAEVKDIIVSPPSSDKYDKLKSELIKRLTTSKERRIKQLLMHEELGDRKPSQFLRHLQSLAGQAVSEDLMRTIWSSCLPANLQAIVAMQKDNPLETIADLVDHVHDIAPPTIAQVTSTVPESAFNTMCRRVEELTSQVETLILKQQEESRSRSRDRPNYRRINSRSRSRSTTRNNSVCWYHRKFGASAKRCTTPCTFKSENCIGSQ